MRFSRRTDWDRRSNALAERLEALGREGRSLIDLTEANPTRCGFRYEAESISSALAKPEVLRYEPDPRGLAVARQAVARHLSSGARSGVDSERIVLTASTSEAYAFLFKLLCEPGDDVLVPNPCYPLFDFLTGLESVEPRGYPLRFDGAWHLDLAALESSATERTRAVLVVNPGNPTGAFLKRSELLALEALCARTGWALISDEVFADYATGDSSERIESVTADERACLTFALGGLSKLAALPQMKLAWIAVSGPAALRDEALGRLEVIADTYLSVSTVMQHAAPELLATAAPMRRQILERIHGNRRLLARQRSPTAPWSLLEAEGGWYAILRVPREPGEEAVCLRVLDEGVVVHPGYFFDFPSGCHLVLSLLPATDSFTEGTSRLSRVLSAI